MNLSFTHIQVRHSATIVALYYTVYFIRGLNVQVN